MEISFNINLAILVFCVFMLCMFLLNKWLYVPILSFIDSRNNMMQNNIDITNINNKEIESINKEIESILHKAKHEANTIKEKAILEAKDIANKKVLLVKEKHEKDFIVFIEKLSSQKDELRKSLLLRLPSFKIDLLEKLKSNEK